jgi:hypothetical protein
MTTILRSSSICRWHRTECSVRQSAAGAGAWRMGWRLVRSSCVWPTLEPNPRPSKTGAAQQQGRRCTHTPRLQPLKPPSPRPPFCPTPPKPAVMNRTAERRSSYRHHTSSNTNSSRGLVPRRTGSPVTRAQQHRLGNLNMRAANSHNAISAKQGRSTGSHHQETVDAARASRAAQRQEATRAAIDASRHRRAARRVGVTGRPEAGVTSPVADHRQQHRQRRPRPPTSIASSSYLGHGGSGTSALVPAPSTGDPVVDFLRSIELQRHYPKFLALGVDTLEQLFQVISACGFLGGPTPYLTHNTSPTPAHLRGHGALLCTPYTA